MITDILDRLCAVPDPDSVGGTTPEKYAADYLSQFGKVTTDINGNIIAVIGEGDYNILVDAHFDKIGFVVTSIDSFGFLHVAKRGGVDLRVAAGQPVYVDGEKPVRGVICSTPPHLQKEMSEKAPEIDGIYVDIGLEHDDAVKAVSLGDSVYFDMRGAKMLDNRYTAPALDNRAGAAALLLLAKNFHMSRRDLRCRLTIMLSNQEELGCRGAMTGAAAILPDEALVVDVSFGDSPDVPSHKSGRTGAGPMIGISPTLDPKMTAILRSISSGGAPSCQNEVMGGETGTNADVISAVGAGIPTALVSIPLRNMHTPAETVCTDDIAATADLLFKYIIETRVI